jgi:hypothetical protein
MQRRAPQLSRTIMKQLRWIIICSFIAMSLHAAAMMAVAHRTDCRQNSQSGILFIDNVGEQATHIFGADAILIDRYPLNVYLPSLPGIRFYDFNDFVPKRQFLPSTKVFKDVYAPTDSVEKWFIDSEDTQRGRIRILQGGWPMRCFSMRNILLAEYIKMDDMKSVHSNYLWVHAMPTKGVIYSISLPALVVNTCIWSVICFIVVLVVKMCCISDFKR